MSNQKNNSRRVELFLKMMNHALMRSEIKELTGQLNVLHQNDTITPIEYNILFDMLDKITSVETRKIKEAELEHANQAVKEKYRLDHTLNNKELYYLQAMILKLQGELDSEFFVNPKMLDIFPNVQSFQDFVMKKNNSHVIGTGGFGKVFQINAYDQSFVLKEMILKNTRSLTLVQDEIQALQMVIGKWYAVQLLASAILIDKEITLERLGVAYILYPYIPGETLAVYQETNHPNEEEIYSDIIEAVHRLHIDIGILHSDIKPENIWIPTDPIIRPFLLDFGLVQSLQSEVALNVGTDFFWSAQRFTEKGKSKQPMTTGINWLALARTLGSELTNHNDRLLPDLRERFKKLYHAKTERNITHNNMTRTLRGNQNIRNRNMNRNTTKRRKAHSI